MLKVEGVPESVTHDQVLAVVRALGFDPEWLTALRITTRTLEVDVHISRPASIRADRDDSATHTITYILLPTYASSAAEPAKSEG